MALYKYPSTTAGFDRCRGPPIKGGWTAQGEGSGFVFRFWKGETLDPDPIFYPSTPELPSMVILDARKKGPLGLTSTFLLLMHLGEWLAMRN